MPRPLRPVADKLIYHVVNRGNNRQDVFHKAADFEAFLQATVHLPLKATTLPSIRRSADSGLPLGDKAWVARLAKKLNLDLVIRPRGRPPKQEGELGK